MMDPELAADIAATDQAWAHVREVHGIHRYGSASWAEWHHERAHCRERTPCHPAWTREADPDHHQHPAATVEGDPR